MRLNAEAIFDTIYDFYTKSEMLHEIAISYLCNGYNINYLEDVSIDILNKNETINKLTTVINYESFNGFTIDFQNYPAYKRAIRKQKLKIL